MTLKELVVGFGTQVRSIWMIGMHAFAKRETQMYPEEPVYLPPRYRGRIVLTRDPDGEERCVACNPARCRAAMTAMASTVRKAVSRAIRMTPAWWTKKNNVAARYLMKNLCFGGGFFCPFFT